MATGLIERAQTREGWADRARMPLVAKTACSMSRHLTDFDGTQALSQ